MARLAALIAGIGASCAAPAPPPAGPASGATEPRGRDGRPEALPPLTGVERAHRAELERHVRALATEIGERNTREKWNLAAAADYLAAELEAMGHSVGRQGYEVDGTVSQNLDASVTGRLRGDEVVVVGAHYDSVPGSPGANDNASGTAAVLALARRWRDRQPARTVRFVAFANEELPHFRTPAMGSLVYARSLAARAERVVLMLSIETIGYYSTEPGSQRYPEGVEARFPSTAHFVAIVGRAGQEDHVERALDAFQAVASIPAEGAALPEDVPGVGWSDHWSFWQLGYPAIMVTDTAPFRYPAYHSADDVPDRLDFDRMARVVAGLEAVIDAAAGGAEE